VGETIDETRLEIAAQRSKMEATVEEMRAALDFRARFWENPALFVGLGAAAVFLVIGGPRRVARAARRRISPDAGLKAFDALPDTLQAWIDTLADAAGPRADEVRGSLAEELAHWRRNPVKDRKARQALAREMVDGSPGPSRAIWKAAETALTLASAALARRAIERLLSADRTPRPAAAPAESAAAGDATASTAATEPVYSGFSRMPARDTSKN